MLRGVPIEQPVTWTRGLTPAVEYTGRPLEPPATPQLSRAATRKKRAADARLRRALVDAWCDPARAQRDLLAAGAAYASLRDAQGMANAYMAHAQTRLADAHLADWSEQLSLPASNMAHEEYLQAHKLYSRMLHLQPTMYSASRQKPIHAVCKGQRMRPFPLNLDTEDARAADMGAVNSK